MRDGDGARSVHRGVEHRHARELWLPVRRILHAVPALHRGRLRAPVVALPARLRRVLRGAPADHGVGHSRRDVAVVEDGVEERRATTRVAALLFAPRDVAVDYQSLYEEVKDSIDDYRTRERKALDEVESLKDKEEATQSRILELERENDALKHALQRQQRPHLQYQSQRPQLKRRSQRHIAKFGENVFKDLIANLGNRKFKISISGL